MTSKQALTVIENALLHEGYNEKNTLELIEAIRKDLDILDILSSVIKQFKKQPLSYSKENGEFGEYYHINNINVFLGSTIESWIKGL